MAGLPALARSTLPPVGAARRRAAARSIASAVVGVVAVFFAAETLRAPASSAFVGAGRTQPASSPIARCAEGEALGLEAPPSDVELESKRVDRPRATRHHTPRREQPWTLTYARRELREEADRLRPYIEPLLKRQFSLQEITFALNRQGSKLRHLLFRPRCGLPVFTEYKVKNLMRKASVKPRLIQYRRRQYMPPNAPGAPYQRIMGDTFAEVPPLKPWSPKTGSAAPAAPAAEAKEEAPAAKEEAPADDKDAKKPEDLDELFG